MPRPDGGTDEYHVVLEYAVSLRSLYDMSQQAECGMSRQERDEQVTWSKANYKILKRKRMIYNQDLWYEMLKLKGFTQKPSLW